MRSLIVGELAYSRVQVPDLDRSAQLLIDFGLLPAGEVSRQLRGEATPASLREAIRP